uniref:Wu:fj64h06 n=1 Tax=Labrus bergylta TaxID=56723 RepID=A0A3Q3E6P6_9LABR
MFVFLKHAVSFSRCQRSYSSETLDRYSALLSDAVHSVPPDLLGDLLHEELTEQRDRLLFSEGATGAFSLQSVVSPHVLGEVLVASESGTLNLWTVGRGMQKVREEDSNLYFNAKSAWRWCEFSAHPRVMLYADRTGVELTDIRGSPFVGHTLFRISNTSECRSGERLILSKYLGDAHCFHHLVTTQYSAYIMDERFPGVPMLKWDHYMQSPPMFCHLIPGSASSESAGGGAVTTKVLLAEASSSHGPPQSLLRPRDSLKHLPVQIPHRCEFATNRLSSPAAGLCSSVCLLARERHYSAVPIYKTGKNRGSNSHVLHN